MAAPSRDAVLQTLTEGIVAFESIATDLAPEQWTAATPCADWNAAHLAGHVTCVSNWYHAWLDQAEAGDAAPAFPIDELDERNRDALAELMTGWTGDPATDGPAAATAFATSARTYATRLPAAWDLPFGYPRGTITAGLHAGLAAVEWHVHTWDLAHAAARAHRPEHPDVLLAAASAAVAAAQAPAALRRPATPVGRWAASLKFRGRDPWLVLLAEVGRSPH